MSTCHRCRGTSHVIEGDGPPVCGPCVDLLTAVARDPLAARPELVGCLAARHGDVVKLGSRVIGGGRPRPVWFWTESWPAVEARKA